MVSRSASFPVFAVQSLHFTSVEYSSFQGYMGVPVALIGVLFGPLIDRFGIKRLYMIALIVSAGATLTFAFTPFWWTNTGYVIAIWSIARAEQSDAVRRIHRARDEHLLVARRRNAVRRVHVAVESQSFDRRCGVCARSPDRSRLGGQFPAHFRR